MACGCRKLKLCCALQTLRQKYNIPDLSVPSTSGRDHVAPYSSMSTHCGFDETWDLADDGYTPFPANLPTNESFDSYGRQASGALHLSESQDLWSRIGQVGAFTVMLTQNAPDLRSAAILW